MVNRIKEAFHICIQYPVHLLARDRNAQCIKCLMLAASRAEAVAETEKILLVDALQNPRRSLLDNLVLQGSDAQRPFPTIWFGNPPASRRQSSVGSAVNMNRVLKRNSEELLQIAVQQYEQTGQPQRLYTGFEYQAGTWQRPRQVVVKCEANAQGTNRRAVVTNRPGARTLPHGVYDEYSERGESENRNKELKCELGADRLSDHRYMANCFRMFLHCLANNMLVSLRQAIADPPADECSDNDLDQDAAPVEARTGRARRRDFNRRRQADPLGEGHACTWQMRLIKVAGRIEVTARCVRVFLSSTWPFLDHFRDVGRALLRGS